MIRKFVGGGFKIPCFYCKTFNIVYPQDPDYMHALLEPCLHKDSALTVAITQIGNDFDYLHRLHFSAWYYFCHAI
jgi:hypothetical protein